MAANQSTEETASKPDVAQASVNYQIQQWLSQPSDQDPWTLISSDALSARRVDLPITVEENNGDTPSCCATQGSALECHKGAAEKTPDQQ
ncbi:hypothetical protein TARUN_2377 [Trichoderma arundinaceum]|uniref:Uncharacterized protein n=1 Tax=Trichoderma arundinaceum TaxID=490622 RepID=A0A395NUX0_TRIAR|nr:hypothetical protein TARUN_2377 [Trichoderma arundinaceum]